MMKEPLRDLNGEKHILTGHLPSLDGWRAISITFVIFAHASTSLERFFAQFGSAFAFHYWNFLGLLGVQIFFAISGFLITTKLIEERQMHGKVRILEFYQRRLFRIIPAAFCFITFVILLKFLGQIEVTIGRVVSTLFFISNYSTALGSWYLGHFWSLAVEEHFYILWPLVFVFIRSDREKLVWLSAAAAVCALWRAVDFKYNLTGHSPAQFWGRTDIEADGIIFGVIAAVIVALVGVDRLRQIASRRIFWSLIVLVGLSYFADEIGWKTQFAMLTVRAILIAAIIAMSVINASGLRLSLLAHPAMVFVGSISYSLYLWQQVFLVQDSQAAGWWGDLQNFPINVAFAFTAALASRAFIEKPAIKKGHLVIALCRTRA